MFLVICAGEILLTQRTVHPIECQVFRKNLNLLSGRCEALPTHRADMNQHFFNVNTEPRQSTDAKGASTSGNRMKPVRLPLPMMRGEAGLDAFLQSWIEVWRSVNKDGRRQAILLIFCKSPDSLSCFRRSV